MENVYSPDYIEAHRQQFENGASRFQKFKPNPNYREGIVGSKDGTSFWLSKDHADVIQEVAKGDNRLYETLLDFDEGSLGDSPIMIEPQEVDNLRIPSGNEGGASNNSMWRPDGYTYPGGVPESVIDRVPKDKLNVKKYGMINDERTTN